MMTDKVKCNESLPMAMTIMEMIIMANKCGHYNYNDTHWLLTLVDPLAHSNYCHAHMHADWDEVATSVHACMSDFCINSY